MTSESTPAIKKRALRNPGQSLEEQIDQIVDEHVVVWYYTGTTVEVRPVVLFPEWYVEAQPRGVETWVLNEKAFVKFVENEPERLSKEDVFRLAAALGRYVRDQEEKRN